MYRCMDCIDGWDCIDANESEFLLIEKKSCFHPILCGVDRERLEKKKKEWIEWNMRDLNFLKVPYGYT